MKTKYNKRKYKMQSGVQQIYNDSPDYTDAFRTRDKQNAKREMGSGLARTGLDIAGTAIGVPGLGGIAEGVGSFADSLLTDAKGNYKNKFSEVAGTVLNPMKTAGNLLGAITGDKTAAADLFSGTLGAFGIKNWFGKTSQEKVKEEAKKQEEETRKKNEYRNLYGSYKDVATTDVQASMAKRGKNKIKSKYKVKSRLLNFDYKQPRMIETEGREPIFSPKKKDGSRDLLYYNPNDPTHEEGGVKAVVVPKAQMGKRKTKVDRIPTYIKPLPDMSKMEEDKRMASSKAAGKRGLEYTFDKNPYAEDSAAEEALSIIDPTGVTNWDNVARSYKNFKESKDSFDKTAAGIGLAFDSFGAIPIIGKGTVPFKMTRWALSKGLSKLPKGERIANAIYKSAEKEALPAAKGFLEKTKRFGKNVLKRGFEAADEFGDLDRALRIQEEASGKKRDKKSDKTIGDLVSSKAYGAKQLKVNNLNSAALSQNLTGSIPANAANKFILPAAGKSQVARQIPEDRRRENKKTKRSHKKSSGPVKTVDPPMLYEMKPPPPRSTFNTKNDFKDGTKSLKSEKERKADSTKYAQNVYSTAKDMANKNMTHLITEKRPDNKNYGKKTGANTCLTAACAINKMTGTNLPFNLTKARNADPRVGDNPLETRYNPAFLKNHESLGYKLLKEDDKMQPGDLMQVKKSGRPTHAKVFLGNAVGPILAEDHGEGNDNFGVEISHEDYRQKYNTVKDAKKDGYGWIYRYMGLPKKENGSKEIKVYK